MSSSRLQEVKNNYFFYKIFSEVVAVALERWSFTRGFTYSKRLAYSNVIGNFAVLDKWSRITRACRLGRFDCIQNLFFHSLSSPFLNLKSGAVTLDVFPKASLGEIVHTFCHWLFATRMVTHWAPTKPFLTLLIIFERVNTQDILVTLSEVRKEKKNMELRQGLLTGQEGGSPCQKMNIVIFFIRHVQASQVFILNMKNKKID